MDRPKVFDKHGQEKDWAWLNQDFGAIVLRRAEAPEGVRFVYRVVRLQESEGPAVQVVNVQDSDENVLKGIKVVRHWPDAPQLPSWPPPTSMWHNRGVYGETNIRGDI